MDESNANEWKKREQALLGEIADSLKFYGGVQKVARYWQRVISSVVMIGSILAPATVATGAATSGKQIDLTLLGIQSSSLASISLVITLLVAVAEGFRRIFRFERRWASAWLSGQTLHAAKEDYLDAVIGKPVGSPEWVSEFQKLRKSINGAKNQDGEEFFQSVKADAPTEVKKP
ncbi:hypothetical protein [Rhizobium leguminosarum]|uniref:hypothetical protein n=1 Tax=Rhizobium leguminosarum TaxID=384 RepID=UPI00118368FA|nr:hypothetical protein [Rhizobium leguminosarum]